MQPFEPDWLFIYAVEKDVLALNLFHTGILQNGLRPKLLKAVL